MMKTLAPACLGILRMEQLSGLDSLFTLNESPRSPMHIGALMLYEPVGDSGQALQFAQVYQIFANNLQKSPVFRRKLLPLPYKADIPYWADDADFDLDQHVEACSAAGLTSAQELWQLVADLHAYGLDMKRPLWRATFIEHIDTVEGYAKGTTGLHIQVHHAAIDGMSGAAILAAIHSLTDDSGPAFDQQHQDPWRPQKASPGWWLAYKANSSRWIRQWRKTAKARDISRNVQRLREHVSAARQDRPHNRWAPSPFNAGIDSRRNIAVLSLPFAEVKAVKRALPHTTINHVALCVVGGAMRRYLHALNALPAVSLSTAVPIDVRDPQDEHGGNVLSATITALRTDIEDPLQRLAAVRDCAIEARENAAVLGETTLLELSSVLSQRTSSTLLKLISVVGRLPFNTPMPFNTLVSNVPGSPIDLYLAGARLANMHAFGLIMDGMGLFHTATSYKDRFSITALSCPSCLPDIDLYQQCLEQSWRELYEALVEHTPREKAEVLALSIDP
jgi:WS/DGAT/MGAT family acyltransferase